MAALREIIVGYDGSACAIGALRRACALADEGSHVTVLTAYRIPPEFHSYEFFQDLVGAMEGRAEELLGSAREVVPDGPFEVSYVKVEGSPAEALAFYAAEHGADLVVVGSRGLGRLRAALGSVTTQLLHDAPCPVLVVPTSKTPKAAAAVRQE